VNRCHAKIRALVEQPTDSLRDAARHGRYADLAAWVEPHKLHRWAGQGLLGRRISV
jgi:hypothetical protein